METGMDMLEGGICEHSTKDMWLVLRPFLSPVNHEYEDSVLAYKFDIIAPTAPSEVSRYQI